MSKELIERLRKFIGGELGNGAADALEETALRADSLAEVIRSLSDVVTTDHESKDVFIARVRAILWDNPGSRVSEIRKELDAANFRLHEVAVGCATAEQERDAIAEELKALREQEPVAWGDEPWMASFGVRVGRDSSNSIDLIFTTVGQRKFQLYAHEAAYLRGLLNKAEIPGYPNTHPVPARELTDEDILNALDGKVGTQFLTTPVTCKEFWLTAGSVDVREFVRAIEAAIKGEGK